MPSKTKKKSCFQSSVQKLQIENYWQIKQNKNNKEKKVDFLYYKTMSTIKKFFVNLLEKINENKILYLRD